MALFLASNLSHNAEKIGKINLHLEREEREREREREN